MKKLNIDAVERELSRGYKPKYKKIFLSREDHNMLLLRIYHIKTGQANKMMAPMGAIKKILALIDFQVFREVNNNNCEGK